MVYTLSDPESQEIRYVGVTHNPLSRLSEHLSKAKGGENNHRACWIRSLLKKGLAPLFQVVETGAGGGWADREMQWISDLRGKGCRLVNGTDGGEGTLGYKAPPRVEG